MLVFALVTNKQKLAEFYGNCLVKSNQIEKDIHTYWASAADTIICYQNFSKLQFKWFKDFQLVKIYFSDSRKQAHNRGVAVPNRNISGAGLSFALDKILSALNTCHSDDMNTTDVVVCVCGYRPNFRDVTQILKSLWSSGIQCAVVQASNPEDGQDMAKDLGAVYYVVYCDDGILRVRSWVNERFEERVLNRDEIIAYVKKSLKPDTSTEQTVFQQSISLNDINKNNHKSNAILAEPTLPTLDVIFNTIEKMSASTRRRYENVLSHYMSTSLLLFNKREQISVIAVDLQPIVIRAIVGAIDPRGTNSKIVASEVAYVIERFPENKRYIKDIVEEINDIYAEKKGSSVVCLYCLKDSYYRFIL